MSDLTRFIKAQENDFETAFSEIQSGMKRSHWIWYIFPQIAGLGFSPTARFYEIKDIQEAKDFMSNEYLSSNLLKITRALLELDTSDISSVMGYPDDLKLCSSMTLFELVSPECVEFAQVLDRFYGGRRDNLTLKILESQK